jgi:tetratricopeptide (TPR) repeat protein
MSSLTTKANKSRSVASPKLAAKPSKKTIKNEAKRPVTAKSSGKTAKAVMLKGQKQLPVNKKAPAPKVMAKAAAAKSAKKIAVKPVAAKSKVAPKGKKEALKKVVLKVAGKAAKPVEAPVKKVSTPNALAAVSSFEQALKLFNKHDYSGAREAFVRILQKFSEQAEIIVSVRKYLAVCEQKLARTPATPKNPDALYDQGVFELNKANVREAIQLFEKALKTQPEADHVLYSLAAAYARTENPRKSLDTLRRAIHLQSVHRSRARSDQDFASLHHDEEFQNLTGFGLGFFED